MKKICAVSFTMILLLASFAASAGQVVGSISYLVQRSSDGLIYMSINGATVGSPACATGAYFMIANETSEAGKKQFAMLLAAKASGLQVKITGRNTCTRGGDGEDIDEVWLLN